MTQPALPLIDDATSAQLRVHLDACRSSHDRICPRQVLGVRVGMAGTAALGEEVTAETKRLLAIVETDGCFVSGLEAATGCRVGHRTLRVHDVGRIAALFVDVETERAVRVCPRPGVRDRVEPWAPDEKGRYQRMLRAYQVMPDAELLRVQEVRLRRPVSEIVSRPHVRVTCATCGEEVINEREVERDGRVLCRVCAGDPYFDLVR